MSTTVRPLDDAPAWQHLTMCANVLLGAGVLQVIFGVLFIFTGIWYSGDSAQFVTAVAYASAGVAGILGGTLFVGVSLGLQGIARIEQRLGR